ncbi:uncharacterized protein LOC131326694 isoform X2 [Rhododendron vialii]|uniref:uncharacterized protein LOC131326694 isoform X2 n=1 Tax=Rhododendron vialii TaxID=182163 RepID=UPI0026605B91|nr:uncharacterized protein LOC131326694 isoform X2 [Rhododendron vialii]XP_058215536.1 uncharacterized protein LOC131326694 isoform X2 [Rhododendron vialii]
MRVDLECSDGRQTLALFSHRRLSVFATAAFAIAILEGSMQAGVWFPEENIFSGASQITYSFSPCSLKESRLSFPYSYFQRASMDGGNRSQRACFRNVSIETLTRGAIRKKKTPLTD